MKKFYLLTRDLRNIVDGALQSVLPYYNKNDSAYSHDSHTAACTFQTSSADFWNAVASASVSFKSMTRTTPHAPRQQGRLRKTSSSTPWYPRTQVDTGINVLSSVTTAAVIRAIANPIAQFVYPFFFMTVDPDVITSACIARCASFGSPPCGRMGDPPTFMLLQTGTLESPCSPITNPCTVFVSTSKLAPTRDRRRLESKAVPDPKMRPGGTSGPAARAATAVMTSHGFDTIQMGASGLCFKR
mmetsp:Transcript_25000/g.45271  ORF Transcript_25000/g.45271 Transcript_25000/m.45271 type:complete len:243 (-) Transcript_25000:675-1403(-)